MTDNSWFDAAAQNEASRYYVLCRDIAQEMTEQGFDGVTAEDVVMVHQRIKEGKPPFSVMGRAIGEMLEARADQ